MFKRANEAMKGLRFRGLIGILMLIGVQSWFACGSGMILLGGGPAEDVAEGYFLDHHGRQTRVTENTWRVAGIIGRVHAVASVVLFGSLIAAAISAFKNWQWYQSGADYTPAVYVSIGLGLFCAIAADLVRPSP